ncbi:MAG TPA: NADH-quinone oxidoreductase subunit C [Candidatus Limnocylindria bacterium]|nr:NADH-quinone oxidoreductase subunit C [Candidatus Limnocylindria bacterium]
MSALEFANQLKAKFGDLLSEPNEFRGEVTLKVADAECIAEVCEFAKNSLGFNMLLDISSIDNYGEDPRWTIVYELYHMEQKSHLRLKTEVSEEKSELPTITTVWRTADWHEREIYDMMGVRFRGHPDLRRILMWDGYPYFPLRKDFPLAGKPTDLPEVAFTKPAPLDGGPFVTVPGGKDAMAREPRVRIPLTESVATISRLERRDDVKKAHEPDAPQPNEAMRKQ